MPEMRSIPHAAHWAEALYEECAARLVLYGRAFGLSHSEAEDVLHDTFVALLKRPEPPEQPDHYCLRAFRNRALNYRRSLWRRLTRELEARHWFEHSVDETPQEKALTSALEALPPVQREAIVLKIWHRYTFEEIGTLLGISPQTVAGRYRYGLEKVKRYLEEDIHERSERPREPARLLGPSPAIAKT